MKQRFSFSFALCAVLVSLSCLFLASCALEKKILTCSMDELFTQIAEKNAEGELYPYSAERLEDDIQISPNLYTEGRLMIPMESPGVETIAFFKAADEDAALKIKAALDKFVNDTKVYQEKYNADNFAVASSAVTKMEGVYVYLVMSPAKTNIVKVINENLK